MAACPVAIPASPASPTSIIWRRPIALSPRRIEANRRNASRSTGPRTPKGKARVARNAIKHGFFASTERWTLRQHRDFEELMAGLREDFQPRDTHEDGCVATIAASYVRMAALWRYENIAARKHHEECTRDLDTQIAMAESAEAEALRAHREELRRAGLWGPTIPAPREAAAICRYQGKLDRTIRAAMSDLPGLKASRAPARHSKTQKQTHLIAGNSKDFCDIRMTQKVVFRRRLQRRANSIVERCHASFTATPRPRFLRKLKCENKPIKCNPAFNRQSS